VQHQKNKKIIPDTEKEWSAEFLPDLVTILELMPYGLEYLYSTSMGRTGVLAYIILWIVVPAVTTSEKLKWTS
jgi:hypothetical protein